MANEQNLTPVQPGQVLNPKGRGKGVPNRKTILNYMLFEANLEDLIEPTQKPSWWDKVKPKNLYEAMTMAMAVQAMAGNTKAFSALNKALGDYQINEENISVVHIFKPEKLSIDDLNAEGDRLRQHNREVIEAEVIDDSVESTARSTDNSITSA